MNMYNARITIPQNLAFSLVQILESSIIIIFYHLRLGQDRYKHGIAISKLIEGLVNFSLSRTYKH